MGLDRGVGEDAGRATLAIMARTHFGLSPFSSIGCGNVHMRCGFPPQGDFRTIHAIDTRLAAGCAACGDDGVSGQETELHKTECDVVGKVKAFEAGGNAKPEFI